MVKIVQMAKGYGTYTFCHIKSLWKQYSSPILNTSEWCEIYFYFVFFKKFDFDPDPEMDPEPVRIRNYLKSRLRSRIRK